MIELLTANIGIISYALAGLIYAKMENDMFDVEFEGYSTFQIATFHIQMALHFFRVVLTWPIYVAEDFTVWLSNLGVSEDDDEEDDDDGIV